MWRVQAARRQAVEAMNSAGASDSHQGYVLAVARLETDGGAGGDVQPHAKGRFPVEAQCPVGLKEMEVGTHLDGPVAGVPHREPGSGPAGVDFNRIIGKDVVVGWVAHGGVALGSDYGVVYGNQLGTVGKGSLHLDHETISSGTPSITSSRVRT